MQKVLKTIFMLIKNYFHSNYPQAPNDERCEKYRIKCKKKCQNNNKECQEKCEKEKEECKKECRNEGNGNCVKYGPNYPWAQEPFSVMNYWQISALERHYDFR